MTNLAKCPFCNGDAERYDDYNTASPNEGMSCIQCKRCGASSAMHGDRKENLIDSWNTRATSSPKQMIAEGRAITVIIPVGYVTALDFLNDCGLEEVSLTGENGK